MKSLISHLVFNVGLLVLVQVDLEESGAVKTDPGALANDLGGVDQVIEDGVVNSNQGTGPGIKKTKIKNTNGLKQILNFKLKQCKVNRLKQQF